tara:strand:- start:535 stop:786 length:252 start_codon:yes stop_codon:yes gene_type:complete
MANFNPLMMGWLTMASYICLRLASRKSINWHRPFQLVVATVFVVPSAEGFDLQAHRALVRYLVTHAHNWACELKYFVLISLDY